MINVLLSLGLLFTGSAQAVGDSPMTEVVGADLLCKSPGTVVYVNNDQERMWLSKPGSAVGIEPLIIKFLNTGKRSLFVKAEADLFGEKVTLFFTLRDHFVNGEVLETGLRATLRIIDVTGEESAVLRFRCFKAWQSVYIPV